jgi:hypothetical protein
VIFVLPAKHRGDGAEVGELGSRPVKRNDVPCVKIRGQFCVLVKTVLKPSDEGMLADILEYQIFDCPAAVF